MKVISFIILCIFCLTNCNTFAEVTQDKPIYIVKIDFSLPSTQKRLFVINKQTQIVVFSTFVTHGRNSGTLYATKFSNKDGSYMSCLGKFITTTTYYGKNGLSLRVKGLDKGINDNAASRYIVIHGADYIGDGKTGRSLGCFAVPVKDLEPLIRLIGSGTMIYVAN